MHSIVVVTLLAVLVAVAGVQQAAAKPYRLVTKIFMVLRAGPVNYFAILVLRAGSLQNVATQKLDRNK